MVCASVACTLLTNHAKHNESVYEPEMHRLGSHRAVPEFRKAFLLHRRVRDSRKASAQQRLAEEVWADAGEDAGAGSKRHIGCLFSLF
jgi:hypothetical protein